MVILDEASMINGIDALMFMSLSMGKHLGEVTLSGNHNQLGSVVLLAK